MTDKPESLSKEAARERVKQEAHFWEGPPAQAHIPFDAHMRCIKNNIAYLVQGILIVDGTFLTAISLVPKREIKSAAERESVRRFAIEQVFKQLVTKLLDANRHARGEVVRESIITGADGKPVMVSESKDGAIETLENPEIVTARPKIVLP